MNVPRIIIAGLWTDGGKTTVATGIMGALLKKKLDVQAFKSGPDMIDASYHTAVTKKPSRTLDAWLTSPRTVLEIFERSSRDADIAVIEGGMGLFDGMTWMVGGVDDYESTAQIARILQAPVILVVDVGNVQAHIVDMIRNLVFRFSKWFDKKVKVRGIILNNVKSSRRMELKKLIELVAKIPVVGVIPYNPEISLPSRRGGLIPIVGNEALKITLYKLVEHVEKYVDINKVLDIAKKAEELPDIKNKIFPHQPIKEKVTVGVAFDESFHFLFQDNIDLLRAYGAKIVFFSPIHDKKLPADIHGLYFPGGFPDMFAEQLTANQTMRESIRDAAYDEMPIYSEHGGSVYLTKSITDFRGFTFPMVDVLSGEASMETTLQALDSTIMKTIEDNLLSQRGMVIHGREFHFIKIGEISQDSKFAYQMHIGKGINGKYEGWMEHNILALLGHVHLAFNSKLAKNFICHSAQYKRK
jgi:cobyrinic acid a,c-diamide synthase